jgi:hypothetical protein
MKKFFVVVAVLVIAATISPVFATLGPVVLKFNSWFGLSGSRANYHNRFEIEFRCNVDIWFNDWIKVWFPTSDDKQFISFEDFKAKACGSLPEMNGVLESQRFIPNEEYFKKYPQSKEKEIFKLYEFTDNKGTYKEQTCKTGSDIKDENACLVDSPNSRMIKDPSGLGYWLTGSVLRPFSRDDKQIHQDLIDTSHTAGVGYHWCYEMGYPKLINTCQESSWEIRSLVSIEVSRGTYNPAFFGFSKNAKILFPATPGRYRIAIATEPEPTPVESEVFVLPCSNITPLSSTIFNHKVDDSIYTATFRTGEGGALDTDSSEIRVRFPKTVNIPTEIKLKSVLVNGFQLVKPPVLEVVGDEVLMKIICPTGIGNFSEVNVDFLSGSGLDVHKLRDATNIFVATSSEPVFMQMPKAVNDGLPTVFFKPDSEYGVANVNARIILADNKTIKAGEIIKLKFPNEIILPSEIDGSLITLGSETYKGSVLINNNTITLKAFRNISSVLRITISNKANIMLSKTGKYEFTIQVGNDTYRIEAFVGRTGAFLKDFVLSDNQACLLTKVSFKFKPSTEGTLEPGDSIQLYLGGRFEEDISKEDVLIDGKPVLSLETNEKRYKIVFNTPVILSSEKYCEISINKGYANSCGYISDEYDKISSGLVTKVDSVYFEHTLKPAIVVSEFGCYREGLVNDRKICFQNTVGNGTIHYLIEGVDDDFQVFDPMKTIMLPEGFYMTIVKWYSQLSDGKREGTKYRKIEINTTSPDFGITSSKDPVIWTNKKEVTVSGYRTPRHCIDLKTKKVLSTYLDSISMNVNGEEKSILTQIVIPEYVPLDPKLLEWSVKIPVLAGTTSVRFICTDFRNAKKEKAINIDYDDTPPLIKIENYNIYEEYIGYEDDLLDIIIWTYTDANVTIDGVASVMIEPGKFKHKIRIKKGEQKVVVKSQDRAGNVTEKTWTIFGKQRETTIVLTLDKKEWTVNGVEQTPLKTAPATSFAKPHNVLNGNTYMPIAEIAPLLDCTVAWDAKERKVTLTQTPPNGTVKVLELWINKNKGKIDGKEVTYNTKGTLYPAIIGGKTCLPFRWFAENLGASVSYDPKLKRIELIYPK